MSMNDTNIELNEESKGPEDFYEDRVNLEESEISEILDENEKSNEETSVTPSDGNVIGNDISNEIDGTISSGTIARSIALILALTNQALVTFGFNPIPAVDNDVIKLIALIITAIISWIVYWKNNSWSKGATTGDKLKDLIKQQVSDGGELNEIVNQVEVLYKRRNP